MTQTSIYLKPGRDESVLRRHPWIFGGAIARVQGSADGGETVVIRSAKGDFLARAAYNSKSQIAARIWSWAEDESIDAEFFAKRIEQAAQLREDLAATTNAMRLVNSESDGLPGLIVDRYAAFVVCQFLTAGAERWKKEIIDTVARLPGITGVYERSDADTRQKESLEERSGAVAGEEPPETIEIYENDWGFLIDVRTGHKSGFYLDQRENRKVVAELARGREILNAFAYTGAFAVAAWSGGAKDVLNIDSSGPALELAKKNLQLNGLPETGLIEADIFGQLRTYRDSGRKFDMIILDPPKFAHSKGQIQRAARAYKDINWLALRILNPGGYLVTFSCSGLVSEDLFQKILFGAALDAKREAQITRRLSQAGDHPVLLTFPEGAYLKGFICRVV